MVSLQSLFGSEHTPIELQDSGTVQYFTVKVNLKGTNLRAVVAPANTEKPAATLVFIDGFRFQLDLWENQLEESIKYANVLALDLPGAGESDSFDDESTINLVNLIHYWLKTKPLRSELPVCFVASGTTVSVALQLAARLGTACKGCILISGFTNTDPIVKRRGSMHCSTDPTLNCRDVTCDGCYFGDTLRGPHTLYRALAYANKDNQELIEKLKKVDRRVSTSQIHRYIAGHKAVSEAMATKVSVAVLLIEGEESDALETSERWVQWLPNARLVKVPDSKMAVVLEPPGVVNRLIKEFVVGGGESRNIPPLLSLE